MSDWGRFHRHFASDAIHHDGSPECDQTGLWRRVYVFDPDYLRKHNESIRADERQRIAQAIEAVDPVEWALWGQHGGVYAARIARNGGSDV